jgi:hypothetical protein
MGQYAVRVMVSALVVVAVAEIAKRSTFWAAALASLPLTSVLAFVWLHVDGADPERIAALSQSIVWLLLPSLVLLLLFPWLLRVGWHFWTALAVAGTATAVAYGALVWMLSQAGLDV